MISKSKIKWLGKMAFDAEQSGHHLLIDAEEQFGGENRGPSPKGLLLTGLGGCTGMDVVSILKKMKVQEYELEIEVTGEQTDVHPKIYHTIVVNYMFKGKKLPNEKIIRAVELSETRYCGVSEMLRKVSDLKSCIFLNGEELL